MVEPERDDKAEQAAANEKNKQEAEKVLKLQRQELLIQFIAPSNMVGLLSLYVGFLGVVVAFGVLAFYTGHKTTQEIVFFICIILLLLIPIGAIWFLLPVFAKKDALGKRLLDKLKQSSFNRSLARFGNDRRVRLFNLAAFATMIGLAIRTVPAHPRFSLTVVVIYLALSFASVIFWASEVLERDINKSILDINKSMLGILDVIERVWGMTNYALKVAESSREYIDATEPSHNESHTTTAAALRAILNTIQVMADANSIPIPQIDLPSSTEPVDREDDEGVNNG